jgi:hypothetical protein
MEVERNKKYTYWKNKIKKKEFRKKEERGQIKNNEG